jgi:hypothetical protein
VEQRQSKNKTSVTDEECKKVGKLIDAVIYPQIKKQIEILNKHLEKDGIQAGVEITWIFDRLE